MSKKNIKVKKNGNGFVVDYTDEEKNYKTLEDTVKSKIKSGKKPTLDDVYDLMKIIYRKISTQQGELHND